MENKVVPFLRKQKGFQDEITLSVPGRLEVVAISFWDRKENAQSYHTAGYPEVLKFLSKLLDRAPSVRIFEVVGSTSQDNAAHAVA